MNCIEQEIYDNLLVDCPAEIQQLDVYELETHIFDHVMDELVDGVSSMRYDNPRNVFHHMVFFCIDEKIIDFKKIAERLKNV